MSDRDALFAAILANPEEDTPRLVFADWLEEHGEGEQAEFIRRQIALADVPEWDERAIRAQPLEHAVSYGSKWPMPDLPAPFDWMGAPHRRGFLEAVSVSDGAPFIEQLPAACAVAPLCELEWCGQDGESQRGQLPHWRALTESPWLARFRSIKLPLVQLPTADILALDNSPHATRLERFDVKTCKFENDGDATILATGLIRRLTHFAFRLRNDAVDELGRVSGHRLRTFRFTLGQNPDRSPLWASGLLRAPIFQGLKELDLSYNLFAPADLQSLSSSGALRGLESLWLRLCRTGPGAVPALAECADLALRQLVIEQNNLGPRDAQALAGSPRFRELTMLHLAENPIRDTGATALARSPHLPNLLTLDLRNCSIGDKGAQAILDSALPDQLVSLGLLLNDLNPPMKRKFKRRMGDRVIT